MTTLAVAMPKQRPQKRRVRLDRYMALTQERGWTIQKDRMAGLGISQSKASRIESNGPAGFDDDELEDLARRLNVSVAYITGESDERGSPPAARTPQLAIVDDDDLRSLDKEILRVFPTGDFEPEDSDQARRALRKIGAWMREGIPGTNLAGHLLEAAAQARAEKRLTGDVEGDAQLVAMSALARGFKGSLAKVQSDSNAADARARAKSDALERGEDVPPMPRRRK